MKTILIKLCNPVLNIVFAIAIFLALVIMLSPILARYLPSPIYHVLSFFLAVVAGSYLAKYLSKGAGKIELSYDSITVTVHNEYLNRDYSYTIPKKDVNAFEIYKNNFFTKLILYGHGKVHKSFTLLADNDQENALIEFLRNEVRYLDKKGLLSSLSFFTAFLRALIVLTIGAGAIISIYIAINWVYYSVYTLVPSVKIIYWFSLTIPVLVLYNRFHYKNNFRMVGRYATWFVFLFLSTLLYTTLIPASYSLFQSPVNVESLPHSISDYSHRFLIPKRILVDTTQIGYSFTVHTGSRSRFHSVNHYFTTPALDLKHPHALDHHVFIGNRYEQKIRKNLDTEEKTRLRINYSNSKANTFKRDVSKRSAFYEVLYHQNNNAFKHKGFWGSALSAGHYKSPVIVVKPHKESFDEYQDSSKLNILITSLIAIFLLTGNALIVASNR